MATPQPLSPGTTDTMVAGPPTLLTLGAFGLYHSRGSLLLGQGKPLALVTYLRTLPNHSASRDHLLHTLWADRSEVSARHALRQTVWYLRQHLGDQSMAVGAGMITLSTELICDFEVFLAAVEQDRLEEAVNRYRGDFLGSFAVPGGLGFEHWADTERQRLRLLFQRAAELLARRFMQAGRWRQARELSHRIRDSEPLHEAAWRLSLEAAIVGGDRVSASADAEHLESLLTADGRDPEPATLALLRRARTEQLEATSPEERGLVADLTGRESQFAALTSAFRSMPQTGPRIIDVSAPAGLGKTRLLHDFGKQLGIAGKLAVYVRAVPADRDLPWGYAAEIVRKVACLPGAAGVSPATAASLAALDPSISSRWPGVMPDVATGDEALLRRVAAFVELLQSVSEDRPFALLLDDLHWSDSASQCALAHVAARLAGAHVLIVTAHRPEAQVRLVEDANTLRLEPLTAEQVFAFLSSIAALPEHLAPDFPARLRTASGGSPLLLLETLKLALDTGCLALVEGRWHCESLVALFELLDAGSALARRIRQLEPQQTQVLLSLALVGTPLDNPNLAKACGVQNGILSHHLGALERKGLIVRAGGQWLPGHDEIADQVRLLADPDAVAETHTALGEMLSSGPADMESLRVGVWHFLSGAEPHRAITPAVRWIRMTRGAGDRRPARALVTSLLGPNTDRDTQERIYAALPWSLRLPRPKAVAVGTIMATGLFAATITMLPGKPRDNDANVMLGAWTKTPDGTYELRSRALAESHLDRGVTLDSFPAAGVAGLNRPFVAARPGWIAITETFSDSGGEDVVVHQTDRSRRFRATSAPGDDVVGDWSPDGKFLVIQTDRWNPRSMSDIAILTPGEPSAKGIRLTNLEGARDVWPLWSPDGTRIAFVRTRFGEIEGREICLTSVDGENQSCLQVPGHRAIHLTAWASAVEVVGVYADSMGKDQLTVINTETGAHRVLAETARTGFQSRTPGWIACYCRRHLLEPYQSLVFRVREPDQALRLELGDTPAEVELFPARPLQAYLDTLKIRGDSLIPLDGAYQFGLEARDAQGRSLEPLGVRWVSRDQSIASVTPDGMVLPKRPGRVTLRVTAGGWRSDSLNVQVLPSDVRHEDVQDWAAGIRPLWIPFGEPRPFVMQTPAGPAVALNGDSTFASGVYLNRGLSTRDGLGAEFAFRAPITSRSWQYLSVRFVAGEPEQLASWDHRNGQAPLLVDQWRSCGIYYPNEARQDQLELLAGLVRSVNLPDGVPRERWTTVRIQVLPDGRCGVAVNGKPAALIDRKIPLGDKAILVMDAYSHRTQILVGPVTVWRGVRRDVNWDGLR